MSQWQKTTAFDESVCPLLARVTPGSCRSVKSHPRCDGPSTACLALPSAPAASLRSQEPQPSWRPRSARAPTRRRSRSDSDPPRCRRERPRHTACRTQASVNAGNSGAGASPRRPSTHRPDQAVGGYRRVARTDFPLTGLMATRDSRPVVFLSFTGTSPSSSWELRN